MRTYIRISPVVIVLIALFILSCNTSKHSEKKGQAKANDYKLSHTSPSPLKDTSFLCTHQPKKIKLSFIESEAKPIFIPTDIPSQHFKFNGNEGKLIVTPSGMRVAIPANAFVDENGITITGKINFELKEAIKADDIVLGNLTTTYYGMYLESGGMFYTNATTNGKPLKIANGKSLAIEVPTKTYKNDMMIFNGEQKNTEVKWQNPVAIDEQKAARAFMWFEQPTYNFHTWHPNGYWLGNLPFSTTQTITKAVKKTLREHPLTTDTIIKVWSYDVTIMRLLDSNAKPIVQRAFNVYRVDKKTSYLFTTNNLGWANIDRLYHDHRSQKVNFITQVQQLENFEDIYISILFPYKNIYIPGYQKKDGTFSFTHGDYEAPKFPIGEKAIILATGYKNDVPFYALKKVIIAKEQTVSLNLEETTKEELKRTLKAKI